MQFVAQLPLDPAREAGLLPFEVPAGSLLTVFFTGDWDHSASGQNGALLIHGTDDLVELARPAFESSDDELPLGPLCSVRPELVDLYPSAAEALEIVVWELEGPDRASLKKLERQYEETFPNPEDKSRVGGFPHWIQGPAGDLRKFVAQIASDQESDPGLGDYGSLYIFGASPDELTAIFQSN